MRAHESDHTSARHEQRRQSRRAPAEATGPKGSQGLLALQAAVGNAAVVQMLRRADRVEDVEGMGNTEAVEASAATETHRHAPGCGHGEADPPSVQRSSVAGVLRSAGRPLDGRTRDEMERRLGADFSDVRVHTDSAARASATELGARAYTSGNHVVIGKGGGDKHTLAHELTHVVQQRNGPVSGTDTGRGFSVSDPGDRFERAAEANARRVMSGPVPDVQRHVEAGPPVAAGAAGADMVQRTSSTQLEDAVVSHYHPGKRGARLAQNLTVKRPRRVTGKIKPTGTSDRKQAPEPVAVTSLVTSYRSAMGSKGAPDKKQIWKDLFGGAGYDRGHVMGLEVGGSDVDVNIVPQWSLNQGTGMWRQMEKKMVDAKSGDLQFDVHYGTAQGNHRRVMIPERIDITLNNLHYDTWSNEPDVNDLIRSGQDPSDLAYFYMQTKQRLNGKTTLTEGEMDAFALEALAGDKGAFLWHEDYEQNRAQGKTPATSTADTHAQGMTRSDIPKDRRTKLIEAYIKAGWVTKGGSGAAATYTLKDAPEPVFSDVESSSDSDSDVQMSDGSQSPGQLFATIDYGSQDDSSQDPDYEDRMSTGS
ncbi:eCIS core domain-containing protein [Streptomyces alanosinicus]|uniref:eCIS core domain-containing protein n=1 Tax=Streptomyces alanosinicus TaxID=68171 RepID=A0A919D6P7_9ACTN|nr:DUF4157 domain-containing protein [Streptomyces alanosinicus]GHE12578.1 hypothetical protein GCM10010339_76340 [Streptomyces alanosinicus]